MTKLNRRFKSTYKRSDKVWKTISDYLDCFPDQTYKKKDNTYICRCPLSHNHKNNDKHPSFVVNEIYSDKYKKDIVVFSCLSGCCSQSEIAYFFKQKLGV